MADTHTEPQKLSEILAADPRAGALDAAARQRAVAAMEELYWSFFVHTLNDPHGRWTQLDGDLHVDGDLYANDLVVVNGDVRVTGSVLGTAGVWIVLGSFQAQNVVTPWSLCATGDVEVSGLLHVHYNDHVFRAGASLRARALVVDDMDASWPRDRLDVQVYANDQNYDAASAEGVCRHFAPELIDVEKLLEAIEAYAGDDAFLGSPVLPCPKQAWERILAGEPVFRAEVPPPEFGAWVTETLVACRDGLEQSVHRGKDPLVDRILGRYAELAAARIPRTTHRMREAAQERAPLAPFGTALQGHAAALPGGARLTDSAPLRADVARAVEAVGSRWIQWQAADLVDQNAERAVAAAGSLALDGDAHVEGPLIVLGDLDVAGTLALDGAPLLVTGDLRAGHLLATAELIVLGALTVEGLLAAQDRASTRGTLHAVGRVKAHVAALGNFDCEWGAGDPSSTLGPGPEEDWTPALSAAACAALAPEIVECDALVAEGWEDIDAFPEIEPPVDFASAWARARAGSPLLRTEAVPAQWPQWVVRALAATYARDDAALGELSALDPLLERMYRARR